MKPKKTEIIEHGIINNCDYTILITFYEKNKNYLGTAICRCKPTHKNFEGGEIEIVYIECMEWLNNNCKN